MSGIKESFDIARWIAEDLSGMLSEEEREMLQRWRDASGQNARLYEEIARGYTLGQGRGPYSREEVDRQLERFYRRRTLRVRPWRRWMGYAATGLILLGVSVALHFHFQPEKQREMSVPPAIKLAEGEVQLILDTGEQVNLHDLDSITQAEKHIRVERGKELLSYTGENNGQVKEVRFNTLVVPRGTEFKVQLADGTIAWVNSSTRLRYPVDFRGDTREVYLEGEADFEVAKDSLHPFIVRTEEVSVRVLGTRFNVSAYGMDHQVATTLEEGSVEVILPQGSEIIRPDQQLVFDKERKTYVCRDVDASVYSSWKSGKFIFENETLEYIMDRLKMWYDIQVVYRDDTVRYYRFTGGLAKYDDFTKIVRMLEEVAGVRIDIKENCVTIGIN